MVFCFDGEWDDATTSAAICGAMAGCHGQDLYRSERKLHVFRDMLWCGASSQAVAEGVILGECVNLVRRLVNEAPSVMTPVRFAEEATGLAATFGLEIDVWDETRLQQERCGALAGRGAWFGPPTATRDDQVPRV